MLKPRKIKYQEELKVLLEKVFRKDDVNDARWQLQYQYLKDNLDMEMFGESIAYLIHLGKTLDEATNFLEVMFKEKLSYNEKSKTDSGKHGLYEWLTKKGY